MASDARTVSFTKDKNAVKITLPYLGILKQLDGVSPAELDDVLREDIAHSEKHPVYLEVSGEGQECFAFLRNGQIYAAGAIRNAQFVETTIREFLRTANRTGSARVTSYEVDNKILHSLLILVQKKPTLRLLTSLVDLDQVLDKIEEEGKSCIVAASQDEFLAILRYEKGRVTALCHELSATVPQDRSFREDFLVKIYTLSAEKSLTINIYEDLLVKYAPDARTIDGDYRGSISELFLSKPPVVTLEFEDKEIGHWTLDKPVFRIGRTPDNDIVIDNLAVSRTHSVIEEHNGEHYVRDCDSLNGTVVNGRRVGRALLSDGDVMQIGKHKLTFRKHGLAQIAVAPSIDGFDQTMIMHADRHVSSAETNEVSTPRPRLVERHKTGDRVFEIGDSNLTMGKDESADIEIAGFFIARRHAQISKENGRYIIRHIAGHRKLTVEGKPVKEWVLKNNDRIRIGKKEFVFQE
jgi:pSer/pThr/pTyr-binding forkhead associated (FHA) protein